VTSVEDRLERERGARWWRTKRRIGSIERAAAFVDDVGFALLFPKAGLAAPSLWEAASDRPAYSLPEDWGPDIQRVWAWKDDLPARRMAWYGRFLHGRPSFLSVEMLRLLYPRAGRADDFREATLSADARRIAEILLSSGPMPSGLLRGAVRLEGKAGGARYTKAVTELARALVVTHAGTEDFGKGWPSAVLDLTARRFRVGRRRKDATEQATQRFLSTVLSTRPGELGRAFGWKTPEARDRLETLVLLGKATRAGPAFLDARRAGLY
jgi:hypothetical protein